MKLTMAGVQTMFVLVAAGLLLAPSAHAFGTINSAGQRSEHERITRAALACAPGVPSTGDCFEPRSIDQLAGHAGTFGAVGAPDSDEIFVPEAHCDEADFLAIPGYPRTRAQADAALHGCVEHLRMRFHEARDRAEGVLNPDGSLKGPEVDLRTDCTFFLGIGGRAKCNALEGLGRALHGAQDFYSHSNWADEADPTQPISIDNPPGLNRPGPTPILDLRGGGAAAIPPDLATGWFKTVLLVPRDHCPARDDRITHACLNKDLANIDRVTGATIDPQTPRGMVLSNAQKAVSGAIAETRRQWADLRAELLATYGAVRGKRIISALTQDVPRVDLVFAIDTTGSMWDDIGAVQAAAGTIVDDLSTDDDLVDYRIALVDYKDLYSSCSSDGYASRVDLPFSTDKPAILAAINALGASGGCDFPESVYSGLMSAINLPWRDGAKKAIILMGDAPPHDPEPTTGFTAASVVAAALAVDPAEIYAVEIGAGAGASFENLAAGTGGAHFNAARASDVVGAILNAIKLIVNSPIAHAGGPYTGSPGESITFDASRSFDPDGTIVKYEWDFASDGTYDTETASDTTTHAYASPFSGQVTVRVTDNDGHRTITMSPVEIKLTNHPPECSGVVATPSTLWPADHELKLISLSGGGDPDGDAITTSISGVTQDEPVNGGGDGNTTPDAAPGPSPSQVGLRAERSGHGDGRVYRIAFKLTDAHDASCTGTTTVSVAHDQGKGRTPRDSAPASYDSFAP